MESWEGGIGRRRENTAIPAWRLRPAAEQLRMLGDRDVLDLSVVCDDIFMAYRTAFGRAYKKHPKQSAWEGATMFLLGGGNRIPPVRDRLRKTPWPQLRALPRLTPLGRPTDLYEEDGTLFEDDPDFVLTAYGLSYRGIDVPEAAGPSEIPPLDLTPRLPLALDHEDLYSE